MFDPKGRYLYFLSNRDFNLTFSAWEFNYVYTDPTRVYVAVLAADGPALFLPQSDEEKASAPPAPAAAAEEKKEEKKDAKKDAKLVVKIDPAGFENRVRAIPGAPGAYSRLAGVSNGVLYIKGDAERSLKLYNIDDRKEETVLDDVTNYDLSADGEKLIARLGPTYTIIAPKPGQKPNETLLKLDNMEMRIDPRAEWAQEFDDAWRILRDWFYDPDMHGLDWNAIRTKYGQLVPFVAHRADLDYVLGEVAGELNAGHVYVGSPSDLNADRVDNGLLGAEIVADSGVFRIAKIFPGENWHESFRSPLTEPGVKVREGEYILAVDGVPTRGVDNFYRLLENKADRVVTLLVNGKPEAAGAREERVRPVKRETNLRYLDWVASRRAYVDKASGGRIGYIHLPNTAAEGNRELFKSFYPQVDKDALIIDDRYNGGGFIPDRMIELLDRPVLNYWVAPRRGARDDPVVRTRRPEGDAHQRLLLLGRRRPAVLLPQAQARHDHRHAHLGRPHRHLRQPVADGWRLDLRAAVPLLRHRGNVGGGRGGRSARHRSRRPPRPRSGGPGPVARSRGEAPHGPAGEEPAEEGRGAAGEGGTVGARMVHRRAAGGPAGPRPALLRCPCGAGASAGRAAGPPAGAPAASRPVHRRLAGAHPRCAGLRGVPLSRTGCTPPELFQIDPPARIDLHALALEQHPLQLVRVSGAARTDLAPGVDDPVPRYVVARREVVQRVPHLARMPL